MFRMREGLKLARAGSVPVAKGFVLCRSFQNLRQKLCLGQNPFRGQPGGFTGGLDGREIDVRRDVLFAGVGEEVADNLLAKIGA